MGWLKGIFVYAYNGEWPERNQPEKNRWSALPFVVGNSIPFTFARPYIPREKDWLDEALRRVTYTLELEPEPEYDTDCLFASPEWRA